MRKITSIIVALASILALNSCNIDMVDDYTFAHDIYVSVSIDNEGNSKTEKEMQAEAELKTKAIEDFFKSYDEFSKSYHFHGPYHDATNYGFTKHEEFLSQINVENLLALLGEKDYVIYMLKMTGNKTNIPLVKVAFYNHKAEEEEL